MSTSQYQTNVLTGVLYMYEAATFSMANGRLPLRDFSAAAVVFFFVVDDDEQYIEH